MSRASSFLISDNFLLFIFLLIFSTSNEQGSHVIWPPGEPLASEELLKLKLNKFFFTNYFQPAAVITSNAAAWFFP